MRLSTERRCEVGDCQQTRGLQPRRYNGKPVLCCAAHRGDTDKQPHPMWLKGYRAAREEQAGEIMALRQLVRDWSEYVRAEEELRPGSAHYIAELEILEQELCQLRDRTSKLVGEEK